MANANSTLQHQNDVCVSIPMDNFDSVNLLISRAESILDLTYSIQGAGRADALLKGTLETAMDSALKFLSEAKVLLNQKAA